MKDIVGIIISLASFFTAVASLFISRRAFLISQGEIEFEMATIIKDASYRVSDLGLERIKYEEDTRKALSQGQNGNDERIIEDDELYEFLKKDDIYLFKAKMHDESIEIMLNVYDEACAKYLDGKVDKERFKRSYHKSIRNLLESGDFDEQFNTPCSSYKCILRVYDMWYNLEK